MGEKERSQPVDPLAAKKRSKLAWCHDGTEAQRELANIVQKPSREIIRLATLEGAAPVYLQEAAMEELCARADALDAMLSVDPTPPADIQTGPTTLPAGSVEVILGSNPGSLSF